MYVSDLEDKLVKKNQGREQIGTLVASTQGNQALQKLLKAQTA